jgi:hypothetical protein
MLFRQASLPFFESNFGYSCSCLSPCIGSPTYIKWDILAKPGIPAALDFLPWPLLRPFLTLPKCSTSQEHTGVPNFLQSIMEKEKHCNSSWSWRKGQSVYLCFAGPVCDPCWRPNDDGSEEGGKSTAHLWDGFLLESRALPVTAAVAYL